MVYVSCFWTRDDGLVDFSAFLRSFQVIFQQFHFTSTLLKLAFISRLTYLAFIMTFKILLFHICQCSLMQQPKQMLHKPLPDQEIPNFNLTKYFASNFYLPFVSSTTTGETFFFPRLVGVFTHGGGFRIAATVCTLV